MKSARILSTSILGLLTLFTARSVHGQAISLTGTGGVYSQNFNTLINPTTWINNSTLPAWYAQTDTLTSNIPLLSYTQGAANPATLGFYSMGTSTDRALGFRPTTASYANTAIGVVLQNNTGGVMKVQQIVYTGKMYVTQSDTVNNVDGYQFFYQKSTGTPVTNLSPFTINNGAGYFINAGVGDNGWTRVSDLDYTATSATVSTVLSPPQTTDLALAFPNLTLNPGEYITLRWRNPNDAGSDAMIGIDNFAFSYVTPGSDLVYDRAHTVGGAPNGVLAVGAGNYWKKGGVPSDFAVGDRITFSDPGDATINVTADAVVDRMSVTAASGTYTIGGAGRIFGDLVKSGAGNLVLTSANSFSTINLAGGGSIVGTAQGALNTVKLIMGTGGGKLDITGDNSLRKIEGSGDFTKAGTGTLTLGGNDANTFFGDLTIAAGVVIANKAADVNAVPQSLNIGNGAAFRYAGNSNQVDDSATITIGQGGAFGDITPAPLATSPAISESVRSVLNNGGTFGTSRGVFAATDEFVQTSGLTLIQREGQLISSRVSIGGTLSLEGANPSLDGKLVVGVDGLTLNSGTINFNSGAAGRGSTIVLGGPLVTTGDSKMLKVNPSGLAQLDFGGLGRAIDVTGTLNFGETGKPIEITNAGVDGLSKFGTGTLNYFGNHTSTIPIGVSEGKLVINGNLPTLALRVEGPTAVFGGTTPTGTSVAGETQVVNFGRIEAGINGFGSLIFSKLTLGEANGDQAFLTLTANDPNPANIKVTATNGFSVFTASGGVTINLLGDRPTVGDHILIDYAGTIQGPSGDPILAFKLGTLPARLNATLVNDLVNTAVILRVVGNDRPIWTGVESTEWRLGSIAGQKNWKSEALNTPTDFQTGDQVLFNDTVPAANPAVTITGDVNPANVTFANITKSYSVTGSSSIVGSGFLTKTGAATVSLNTSNSFTGGANLNGGKIVVFQVANIGQNSSLGSNGTIAFDGGTLNYSGLPATTNRLHTFNGAGGTLEIESEMTISSTLGGTASLIKTGLGALKLTGDNSVYTGGLVIKNGSIVVTDAIANLGGLGGPTQKVTLDGGALSDASTTATETFFSTATSILRQLSIGSAGGTINVVNGTHALVIENTAGITGSGPLAKNGAGTLRMRGGTTTYSSNWSVDEGVLEADSVVVGQSPVSSLGTGSVQVNGGGTLAGRNTTVTNAVSLINGKLGTTGGDNTDYAGAVNAEGVFTVDLRDYAAPSTSLSMKISGRLGAGGNITLSGNTNAGGTLTLTNPNNTYNGSFLVQAGQTLLVQSTGPGNPLNTAQVQLTDASLALRFDSGSSNGVFNYTGTNLTISGTGTSRLEVNRADIDNGVSTGNAFRLGTLTMGSQTLTVAGGNGYRVEIAGATTLAGTSKINTESADLDLKGSLTGTLGLTKTGAARLILEGNNTALSGNIAIQEGTLVLRNSNLPNGNVNLTGGRLAGTGTITNAVLMSSATSALSPGENGAGILTLQKSLTFVAGADFEVNTGGGVGNPIPGSTYDQVRVGNGVGAVNNGTVTLAGSDLMITLGTGIQVNDLFFLIVNDGTDAVNGTFLGLIQGQEFTVNGQGWRISYNANTVDGLTGTFSDANGNDVALMAVPEPGSAALLLGGLGLVAASRRRRTR